MCVARLEGQRARDADRYDPAFRKYTKRFFGPAFDWRHFKAQGLAESGLDRVAGVLAGGGVFVLQQDAGADPPELAGLALQTRRGYGRNVFSFFGML